MVIELITSISATWNIIKFFNDDYFFEKEKQKEKIPIVSLNMLEKLLSKMVKGCLS